MSAENQVMLSHTTQSGGRDAEEIFDDVRSGAVELNPPSTLKLASWTEIVCSTARVGSVSGGCRSGYDWTLNAVRTAEKRPACIAHVNGCQAMCIVCSKYSRRRDACQSPLSTSSPYCHYTFLLLSRSPPTRAPFPSLCRNLFVRSLNPMWAPFSIHTCSVIIKRTSRVGTHDPRNGFR